MEDNDRRIIERAEQLDAEGVLAEALSNHNACGGGAFAAGVAAAKDLGASRGVLLRYTTSHDVMPEGPFRMAVGYAGMLF